MIFEQVGDADGGRYRLNPGLQESEIRVIAESQRVESFGFLACNLPGSRPAGGVRVFVMANQRLPVSVTRSLNRLANLFPAECHAARFAPRYARSGRPRRE